MRELLQCQPASGMITLARGTLVSRAMLPLATNSGRSQSAVGVGNRRNINVSKVLWPMIGNESGGLGVLLWENASGDVCSSELLNEFL
jgi:hypothetical protein